MKASELPWHRQRTQTYTGTLAVRLADMLIRHQSLCSHARWDGEGPDQKLVVCWRVDE